MYVCESKDPAQTLYVSRNESLIFAREGDVYKYDTLHFDLVRIKLCFELVLEDGTIKKIGGEVVDLSISQPDGVDQTPPQFKSLSNGSYTQIYQTYNLQTPIDVYSIDSYSLPGLIYDIVRILFIEIANPWDDKKYKKRIKRIMGLLLCEAFMEQSHGVPTQILTGLMRCLIDVHAYRRACQDTNCHWIKETIWIFVGSHIHEVLHKTDAAHSAQLNEFAHILETLVVTNIDILQTTPPPLDVYTQTNMS